MFQNNKYFLFLTNPLQSVQNKIPTEYEDR
jgi:hypothetical protein